jgi:flagellar biogenesis protein FliO
MTACLPIVIAVVSLAADAPEAPASGSAALHRAKVVANRSSIPEVSPGPPAPPGDSGSEDRPVERRTPRVSRDSQGGDAAIARAGGRNTGEGWLARIRGLWPLAVVLALIGALVLLARRLLPRQWRGGAAGRTMVDVLGRHALSARQSVALLKVGRRIVLVGLAPDRITHLDTISDPDEVAELVGRSTSGKNGSLTSTFEREVLREAAAYEPSRDDEAVGADARSDRTAAYLAARQQLRGLLNRVRSMAGAT